MPAVRKRHSAASTQATRVLAEAGLDDVDILTERLVSAIFTDNPEWTDYGSVPRDDLREGCRNYLVRVLESLRGQRGGTDEVVETIAKHRADQGIPLEVMLRTFRLGGRIVWEALLTRAKDTGVDPDVVLDAGTATWTVIDELSSALSSAYRESEQERVRHDEQRRNALIEDLLDRRAGDTGFASQVARELDLPVDGGYLVIVTDVGPDGAPALASPRNTLDAWGFRSLWHSKVDSRIGVVALDQRSAADVITRLRPLVRGRSAASSAVRGLADVAAAYTEALIALSLVAVGSTELVWLDEHLSEALLVRSPDFAQRLISRNLGGLLARPAHEREVLLETLLVWLEEDRSTVNAAARLHCHRNTVLNRLQRVTELVGRSLHGRSAYVELSLALSALNISGERR